MTGSWMTGSRTARRAAAAVAGALLTLGALVLPAGRATAAPAEQVRGNHVVLTVRSNGLLHVHEAITYDFGSARTRHGLVRSIPHRTGGREYDLEHLTATSPDAPAGTHVDEGDGEWTIRIGDSGSTVTGVHTYLLDYDVRYALTPDKSDDDLYWDAVGTGWDVPTAGATVTVTAPAAFTFTGCTVGSGSTPCRRDTSASTAASVTFTAALRAHQGMTVDVTLPHGAVTVPAPRYLPSPGWWRVSGLGYLLLGVSALAIALGVVRRAWGRIDARFDHRRTPPDALTYAVATRHRSRLPAAMLVDLAMRGHVRITDTGSRFTLTRTGRSADDLDEQQLAFVDAVFPKGKRGLNGKRGLTSDPDGRTKAWEYSTTARIDDELRRRPRRLWEWLDFCADLMEDVQDFSPGLVAIWLLVLLVAALKAGGVTDLVAGGVALLLFAAGAVLALWGGFRGPSPRARQKERLAPPPVRRMRYAWPASESDDAGVMAHLPFVVPQVDPGALERMATGRVDALDWYDYRGDGDAAARFALLPWLFTPAAARPQRSEDGRWGYPDRASRRSSGSGSSGRSSGSSSGSRSSTSSSYGSDHNTYQDYGSSSSGSDSSSSGGFGGGGGDSW